jgi:hypothetical protein
VGGEVLGRYGRIINDKIPRDSRGNPQYVTTADFNFGYQPIDGNYPSASPGAYTVGAGDTLQTIARGAYGDSALWYLVADANGLSGNQDLRIGQTLTIPNQTGTIHNNASTFKPYDQSKVVGDITPNMPNPTLLQADGCGGLGTILIVVVVTIYTAGAGNEA